MSTISASALCENFPVFSVLKFSGVGTFLLVLMLGAAATFCMGCAQGGQPDPGSVTNIQHSLPGTCNTGATAASHACVHPAILSSVGCLTCALVILKLVRIILDAGPCKDLKIGKDAMLSTRRLVKFVPPQVASWFGGLPAAAKEVGNLKCCGAVSAAASSRAHVPPCANASDGVISTAGFMKARFLVINSLCTQECCAGTDGDVLGLRFIEALLVFCLNTVAASGRMGTSPPVACPWVTGFRLQDGWTSPAVTSRQMPADALAAAAKSTEWVGFFVKALNRSSLSITVKREETILDLALLLSVRTGIPEHLFYLGRQGKVLPGSWSLARADITSDSHVHMCARLLGGAGGGRVPIQGEWNCQSCGMVGCWPTKHQCFRCAYARRHAHGNGGAIGGKFGGTPSTGEQNAFRTASQRTRLRTEVTPPSFPAPAPDVKGGDMTLLVAFVTNAWSAAGSHESGRVQAGPSSPQGGLFWESVVLVQQPNWIGFW